MEKIIDTFSHRLKHAMEIRHLKASELSEKSHIAKSSLSEYLSGKYEAKQDGVYLLANALDVNPAWLMGYDIPMNNINIKTKQTYPILGTVKAGYDYLAQENYTGYVTMDRNVSDPENYYALRVTGDSMEPILNDNDIVIVHQQYNVESGQVAIVLLNDEEATIKKVIKHDKNIELIAFNSYYPSKIVKDYKIIGRVVEARISKVFN